MRKVAERRVFADHYHFYLYDSEAEPCDDMPDWDAAALDRGYIANPRVIHVGTQAHLNDHWVEVWLAEALPTDDSSDRTFARSVEVSSGTLSVAGPMDPKAEVLEIPVDPGVYSVRVEAFNLGIDSYSLGELDESDAEPSDEDIAARADIERYRVVIVPA